MPTSTIHSQLHTPLAVAPAGDTMDERLLHVRQQPDGYHWVDEETGREAGPFESVEDALADMNGVQAEAIERSDTVDEGQEGADRALVDVQGADEPEAST